MRSVIARLLRALRGRGAPAPRPTARQTPARPHTSAVNSGPVNGGGGFLPPPKLAVRGWHSLRETQDVTWAGRDVPGDLRVPRDLVLAGNPRLRSLGAGLFVPGNLKIGGFPPRSYTLSYEQRRVPIVTLPSGLRVHESLELRNCFRLQRLPDDVSVGGSIVIEDCDALTSLPDPLHVRGSLRIVGGQSLTALPKSLRVNGDFHLAGTRVSELPPELVVGGSLIVEGRSRVAHVPADLQVHGDIVLRRCPIESLPAGLRVPANLRLIGARKLKRLPEGLAVPGKLDLSDCAALERLPAGLTVGHSLKLRGCTALRELPEGLSVPRTLDLRGCTSLASLPRGMSVGAQLAAERHSNHASQFTPALRLADCTQLTELPDDIVLGGAVEVAGSGLRDLPASLADARVLWRGVLVPAGVVFHPERLAPVDVLRQPNAELRRVMLERLGADAVLDALGATVLDADTDAGGPRRLVVVRQLNHCYLLCRCPSTAREYLLRVPLTTRTCAGAAAWMAGFDDPRRYRPIVET